MRLLLLLGLIILPQHVSSLDHAGPGVHLSLGTQAGDIVVSWSTALSTAGAYVLYGTSPDALDTRVVATSEVLANNEAKDGPSAKAVQWRNISVHRALITGLASRSQPVFYSCRVSGDPDHRVLNFTYTIPHDRAGALRCVGNGCQLAAEREHHP